MSNWHACQRSHAETTLTVTSLLPTLPGTNAAPSCNRPSTTRHTVHGGIVMRKTVLLCSLALLVLGGYAGNAHSTERTPAPSAQTAPDNTGRNVRDRSGATLTPGDQSE